LEDLRAIGNMSPPEVIDSRRRNQIDRLSPLLKEFRKMLQTFLCFT